jgi:hypothetical protein
MKKTLHLSILLFFLLSSVCLAFPKPVQALPLTTFYVTTNIDAHDSNISDGICYNSVLNACSLRAAVEQANGMGSAVTIYFSPEYSGNTFNISLDILELSGGSIYIDGQTNNIIIDGSTLASDKTTILRLTGSGNELNNLTIRNGHHNAVEIGVISGTGEGSYSGLSNITFIGNGDSAVAMYSGVQNNITGNLIGFSRNGSAAPQCVEAERNGNGILIENNAQSTYIENNSIGCNYQYGIKKNGGFDFLIRNNQIGLYDSTSLPNGLDGVFDQSGIDTNFYSNTISGNNNNGVRLNGTYGSYFSNNKIGTDSTGTIAVPNGQDGIYIDQDAKNNRIGGLPNSSLRNIISGNSHCGIYMTSGPTGTYIDYNLIGLNAKGDAAIPNGYAGICLINNHGTTIGGPLNGINQYISGNKGMGIFVDGGSDINILPSNHIGIAIDNSSLGNGRQGILLQGVSNSYINPTTIANNHDAGIALSGGETAINNKFIFINAYNNDGPVIDLGNDGPTKNDPLDADSGPNHLLNYPEITGFSSNPLRVQGTACPNCEVRILDGHNNPNGPKDGGKYLNHVYADASGNWSYSFTDDTFKIFDLSFYTVSTSDTGLGDTSELSPHPGYFNYLPILKN